jgi:hypothetical protein
MRPQVQTTKKKKKKEPNPGVCPVVPGIQRGSAHLSSEQEIMARLLADPRIDRHISMLTSSLSPVKKLMPGAEPG